MNAKRLSKLSFSHCYHFFNPDKVGVQILSAGVLFVDLRCMPEIGASFIADAGSCSLTIRCIVSVTHFQTMTLHHIDHKCSWVDKGMRLS